MHFTCKIIILLLLTVTVQAQEHFSVHKYHKEIYGTGYQAEAVDEPAEIIPLQFDKAAQTGKLVFGFLPYWEYPGTLDNIHWDLMTHVAAFDFQVDSLGNIANPTGWPWTTLINNAHTNGVKVIMTAVNFDASELHYLLTNSAARQNFFSKVSAKINAYSFDGINIDFEGLNTADRGSVVNGFMTDLTNYVHTNHPGKEVSFAGPAVNWSGWNLTGLAAACDYIFIMGYDFAGSWSTVTAPPAPLTGGSYNITNTVTSQYNGCPPEKLILGVPYYGAEWKTPTNLPGATVTDFLSSPRFYAAMDQQQYYGLQWHASSQTTYYMIPVYSYFNQVWFDDPRATALKFALAKQHNLKGVGMWALNYDRTRPELWNEISKYLNPSSVDDPVTHPSTFSIGAYPNPFNPATNIRYTIPEAGTVKISLFDITGRLVFENETGEVKTGVHTMEIDLSREASGVYLVRVDLVTAGGIESERLKLQLLK